MQMSEVWLLFGVSVDRKGEDGRMDQEFKSIVRFKGGVRKEWRIACLYSFVTFDFPSCHGIIKTLFSVYFWFTWCRCEQGTG